MGAGPVVFKGHGGETRAAQGGGPYIQRRSPQDKWGGENTGVSL